MSMRFAQWPSKRASLLLFGLVCLAAFAYLGCVPAAYETSGGAGGNVSDYDYLSDYGEWIQVAPFGTVWHPNVVADWSPFSYGHWSWTGDGWTWISYEPFGELVYHYGSWDFAPDIGWFWVPGNEWSPARVQWYTYGDYCAWAPLPPAHVFWPDPWDSYAGNIWVVVNINHFTDDNVVQYRVAERPPREIIQRQTVTKRAPTVRQVEVVRGQPVERVKLVKEPMNVRPRALKGPAKVGHPRNSKLKRMVLPEPEQKKVNQYAPQVERDVLVPKKPAPPEQQQQPERKPEDVKKKQTSRQ